MKRLFMYFIIMELFAQYAEAQNFINGNFDQGPSSGWIKYSKGGYELIGTANFFHSSSITPEVTPRSGQYMARIGGFAYEENSIKQAVTLPNTPKVYMGLYYQDRASTTSECGGLWVGSRIRVIAVGQVLLDQYQCYYNTVNQWTYVYFDLSPVAGRQLEIEFRADAANSVWSFLYLDDVNIFTSLTDIESDHALSCQYKLEQNYPNPFNPETIIKYSIAKREFVSIKVYDFLGKEVYELINQEIEAGYHELKFNVKNLASGVYFYKLTAGEFVSIKKLLLIK
jgi:hypothetical protein